MAKFLTQQEVNRRFPGELTVQQTDRIHLISNQFQGCLEALNNNHGGDRASFDAANQALDVAYGKALVAVLRGESGASDEGGDPERGGAAGSAPGS